MRHLCRMLARLAKWADSIRARFDALAKHIDALGVVVVLAAFTAGTMVLMRVAEPKECRDLPVRIIDLELTFSARRFGALLEALSARHCEGAFLRSLITTDILFPIAYASTLCALFIWVEKQRRFDPSNTRIAVPVPNRNHILLFLPLIAGAADIFVENILLWIAGTLITANPAIAKSGVVDAIVLIGSIGASIKWSLVFLSVLAILGELMYNSRGLIIRRLRYSVIAVMIGALPLLVVPQGQDILQRTIEGTITTGLLRAIIALTFGAYVVWYCGRKLVQLRFPRDPKDARADWYVHFGEQIPRILGISVLVLGAMAFARAGAAMTRFAIVTFLGFLITAAIEKFRPAITQRLGELLVLEDYQASSSLVHGTGKALIATMVGAGILITRDQPRDFVLLRWGAFLLLVDAWVFYLYVYTRRERAIIRQLRPIVRAAQHGDAQTRASAKLVYGLALASGVAKAVASVDPKTLDKAIKRTLIIGAVISLASLAVFTFWTVPSARLLGALIILSMSVASVVFLGSIATWIHERHGVPIAPIALALAAFYSIWNDSHLVRRITGDPSPVAARRDIPTQFKLWRADSASGQLVLVAASGGGLRAAYWTAVSLAALQDSIPDFNRHVFAISSVSGGSVGASVYAALVRDSAASPGKVKCLDTGTTRSFSHCVRDFMAEDYLSPVLAKMVGPDFVQAFLPFPWRQLDRSLGLEESWEDSYEKVTGMPTWRRGFLALYRGGLAPLTVPALFLNTTHVETGKRYITTPLTRGDSTPPLGGRKQTMHDSQDLLELMGSDLPLSTAAHNSARFTYVSPAGRIQRGDTIEYGHVVDGGYFENSGLATLREILEAIRSVDDSSRAIVLYLCNDPLPCRTKPKRDSLPVMARSAVVDWLSPIRALLSTRDARGSLSRVDIADLPNVEFIQLNVCDALTSSAPTQGDSATLGSVQRDKQARERVVSPPLGWLLSKVARDWMDSSLTAGAVSFRPSDCRRSNAAAFKRLQSALKP